MKPKFKKPIFRLVVLFQLIVVLSSLNAQEQTNQTKLNTMEIAFIMFYDYETLDVFGPAEIFGRLVDKYKLTFYSFDGGVITNRHGVPIMTQKIAAIKNPPNIVLVPGGMGTRKEVNNTELLTAIKELSLASDYVLSVCTGSALLAKSGVLEGKQATSNKRAFSWASSQSDKVDWDKKARWKVDGKYYTSSGVSAGMDMTLGFIADRHGIDFARKVAKEIEYNWIEDKDNDGFIAE
ncbi:MAG: DJ-1/PfpI family protein [Maribacter sp.]